MGSHKKKKAPEAAAAAAAAPAAPQDAAPAAAPQQAPEPATLSALKAAEDKQKSLASQLRDVERQVQQWQLQLRRPMRRATLQHWQHPPHPLLPLLLAVVQIYDLETRYLAGCNPNANALKGARVRVETDGQLRRHKNSTCAPAQVAHVLPAPHPAHLLVQATRGCTAWWGRPSLRPRRQRRRTASSAHHPSTSRRARDGLYRTTVRA